MSKEKKEHLLGKSQEQWEGWLKNNEEPSYRSKQIMHALTKEGEVNPLNITSLPKNLREKLGLEFFSPSITKSEIEENSGTSKFLIEADPAKIIETVWLPYEQRISLCVSIQSGCSLDCSFCATGKMPFKGNLSVGGVLAQVNLAQQQMNKKITNVVFMGMGEPFYNYYNTIEAARILNANEAYNIGAKKITISTSGVLPGIESFLQTKQPYTLALSLHSAISEKRKILMDIETRYPLKEISSLLQKERGRLRPNQLTLEYIMIENFNMEQADIKALSKLAKRLNAKVNLIPLNTAYADYRRPSEQQMDQFWQNLKDEGIIAINRRSPGYSIAAACGMLAGKNSAVT